MTLASGNRLVTRGTHTYTSDANGNRRTDALAGTTATYSYDPFNRMSSISRDTAVANCELNDTCPTYPAGTTTYAVNALGQRVYKSGPAGTTTFAYGGAGELQTEQRSGPLPSCWCKANSRHRRRRAAASAREHLHDTV